MPGCPYCKLSSLSGQDGPRVCRAGSFYRKSDGQWVSRFRCTSCKVRFSNATLHECYRQKKRQFNYTIVKMLSSGMSQRRVALNFRLARKTVARKLIFLGAKARVQLEQMNLAITPVREFEFDDLETFEHTKCRPLSVTLAVEAKTRRVLGFEVSRMNANGKLAQKSLAKYGKVIDGRTAARHRLFKRIQPIVHPRALIRSDQNPHYPESVRKHFPHCTHQTVKGRKPANTGQGELKKVVFDPIFSLNHTCAMLRYGVSSLIRKTWCTTKKAERLADRIAIYSVQHNFRLI